MSSSHLGTKGNYKDYQHWNVNSDSTDVPPLVIANRKINRQLLSMAEIGK